MEIDTTEFKSAIGVRRIFLLYLEEAFYINVEKYTPLEDLKDFILCPFKCPLFKNHASQAQVTNHRRRA